MKNLNLLFIILLITLSSSESISESLKITLGSRVTVSSGYAYKLSCSNARGSVVYHVEGLPDGARLDGDLIILSPTAKSGNFVLRVRAVDSFGVDGSQIITLSTVQINAEERLLETVGQQVSDAVNVDSAASRLSNILGTYSSADTLINRP